MYNEDDDGRSQSTFFEGAGYYRVRIVNKVTYYLAITKEIKKINQTRTTIKEQSTWGG